MPAVPKGGTGVRQFHLPASEKNRQFMKNTYSAAQKEQTPRINRFSRLMEAPPELTVFQDSWRQCLPHIIIAALLHVGRCLICERLHRAIANDV